MKEANQSISTEPLAPKSSCSHFTLFDQRSQEQFLVDNISRLIKNFESSTDMIVGSVELLRKANYLTVIITTRLKGEH